MAAKQALCYWENNDLSEAVKYRARSWSGLQKIAAAYPELGASVRGRGMICGLELPERGLASQVSERCFENG